MDAIRGTGSVDGDTAPLKAAVESPRSTDKLISIIETSLCARPNEYSRPVANCDTGVELNSTKIP